MMSMQLSILGASVLLHFGLSMLNIYTPVILITMVGLITQREI